MNSLAEKLVESWLDSQTERRYQPAFIQMLVAQQWTVLHNTRHSPIEFGKDVIARDPAGVLHAFQLKGNPGTRLRKSEAQTILPQIVELISAQVPQTFLKFKSEKFVAVLVTNGEVDEEADLLLRQTTNSVELGTLPATEFKIWSRGALLAGMAERVASIWPTSVDGIRKILNLNASSGFEIAPSGDVAESLREVTHAAGNPKNAAAQVSAITSTLLLLEIIKNPWRQRENHYSLFLVSVIGIVHCLPLAKTKNAKALLESYKTVAIEHALDLIDDARNQHYDPEFAWGQRDLFSEIDFMTERRRLIGDCAAAIALSGVETPQDVSEYILRLISISVEKPVIWGFGAVPALIVRWWSYANDKPKHQSEGMLVRSLAALLKASDRRNADARGIPAPYYSFEECWPWWRNQPSNDEEPIFSDSFRGRIWFGRPILFMLATRNLKEICQALWPDFSRQTHEEACLPDHVFFSPILTTEGTMKTYTLYSEDWNNLVAQAVESGEAKFLDDYGDFAWVIAAYISIAPFRAWTSVLMWLDSKFGKTHFHSGNLP